MPQEAGSIIISLFNRKGKQLSVSSVVDLFSANTTCRSWSRFLFFLLQCVWDWAKCRWASSKCTVSLATLLSPVYRALFFISMANVCGALLHCSHCAKHLVYILTVCLIPALGGDSDAPIIISTLPRRGLRLWVYHGHWLKIPPHYGVELPAGLPSDPDLVALEPRLPPTKNIWLL